MSLSAGSGPAGAMTMMFYHGDLQEFGEPQGFREQSACVAMVSEMGVYTTEYPTTALGGPAEPSGGDTGPAQRTSVMAIPTK